MNDRAIWHHGVVPLHHIQLALIIRGIWKTVNTTALATGTDRHTRNGLITPDTIDRSCPADTVILFLGERDY